MNSRPSRRNFLGALAVGAGGLGSGALLGAELTEDMASASVDNTTETTASARTYSAVQATGEHQSGIASPETPQTFNLTLVSDFSLIADMGFLATVGERLLDLLDDPGLELGDLTATVGIGPRVVAQFDVGLDGSQSLPVFGGDTTLAPASTGGDLLLIVSASDPTTLAPTAEKLLAAVPGAVERWRQFGFRGPGEKGITRNNFGFHDGIVVPRGDAELAENVWLRGDPRTAGGTIAVVRRLRMDTAAFGQLPVVQQEAIVGRRRSDGAPLSGGELTDEVGLTAKTADGQYVTPAGSHVRAAHPATTGSALMLRRGYSYAEGAESGLVFTCFQRDLRTFVATQQRIDERDEMMRYVSVTASASFLVLPGFDRDRPLGSTLTAS